VIGFAEVFLDGLGIEAAGDLLGGCDRELAPATSTRPRRLLSRHPQRDGHRMVEVDGTRLAMATEGSDLHASLMRRVGEAAESSLLVGALAAIWISVGAVVIAAIFK
jgi:hypothetical protein